MYFHTEERQIWLRSHTHTVVRDRDPDFARFACGPGGAVQRILRIWLADRQGSRIRLRAYLGAVTCYTTGPSFRELRRLLRLATAAAANADTSARRLRRDLMALLRRHSQSPVEVSP
ncbi:MAG: hypothetical protein ACYTAS_15310 [Planctomycetota bacterium]|jgi:hypothetical protein